MMTRVASLRAAATALLSVGMMACGTLLGLGDYANAPSDGGTMNDLQVSASGGDGGDAPLGTVDSSGEAVDAGGCPAVRAGAAMAPVGTAGFCIDTTEVTNVQYAAFLDGTPGSVPVSPVCEGNTTYVPSNGWLYATGAGDFPVVWVDWCDAYAYCQWAGKRLCGRIGGGTNPPDGLMDPAESQWYSACSKGGMLEYPYGEMYEEGFCYGAQPPGAPLMAVGSHPDCVGGYPGIFDMSGSVWEWEDSCSAETGPNDRCQIRGGSLYQAAAALTCALNSPASRSGSTADRGFRCCTP
jgi:sulfatase modifying factor 1